MLFNEAMISDSGMRIGDQRLQVVFEGFEFMVDVGGVVRELVARIVSESLPNLQCTVLDLPHVMPSSQLVLHAYSDEECVKVLKKCREAISNEGKGGKAEKRDVDTALTVIQSNTSAATFLASVCLTLCALIGAWIANSTNIFFQSQLIYGDTRPTTISIKYICLLTCFLLAFACFIQSARHFVHANYLISIPDSFVPVSSVELAVIRGGDFWSLGLRALYFALDLLLWFFGPIPMFICSVVMVMVLRYLDSNSRPLHMHPNKSQHSHFPVSREALMYEAQDVCMKAI
ncbi:hypothetical protein SESBI_34559 [Sesbania bispinosa]|nr:hypothetical protein SESBI_34559 [Sesbania bispinosa]